MAAATGRLKFLASHRQGQDVQVPWLLASMCHFLPIFWFTNWAAGPTRRRGALGGSAGRPRVGRRGRARLARLARRRARGCPVPPEALRSDRGESARLLAASPGAGRGPPAGGAAARELGAGRTPDIRRVPLAAARLDPGPGSAVASVGVVVRAVVACSVASSGNVMMTNAAVSIARS